MEELLERSAITASAEHAAAGRGRALVIEAPAGIGKYPRSLPRGARRLTVRIAAVLTARGDRHVVGTIVAARR